MNHRAVIVGLVLIAAIVVSIGAFVAFNWERVSGGIGEGSERARVTLFRLGELGSIAGELDRRVGSRPDVTYDSGPDERVLRIVFDGLDVPDGTPEADHARQIAIASLLFTRKRDQVDVVEVRAGGSYRFERTELLD